MMPLAPTSVMTMPTSKPKIGFSIDSIVGNRNLTKSPNSECSETPLSPVSDYSYPSDFHNHHHRSPKLPTSPAELHRTLPHEFHQRLHRLNNSGSNVSPPPQSRTTEIPRNIPRLPESPPISQQDDRNHNFSLKASPPPQTRLTPDDNRIRRSSQTPSPEPHHQHHHHQQQQQQNSPPQAKQPIMVPGLPAGLVRPFPVAPGHPPPPPNGMDMKQMPQYMNPSEMMSAAAHNQHFLAAQFQAAAALAHAQQGFPPGAGLGQHPAHFNNPNVPRDSYPLYPWLLSRHGRIFPHRFPGSHPDFSDFLLQPFRKPKRVRTAFSPSQLLKLEHAFENNHYVVGAERKTLAQSLSLSETQVKVWFQNRRTKHKRVLQDEDGKGGSGENGSGSPSNPNYEDDDELIDMEMDDCPSDEESDNA